MAINIFILISSTIANRSFVSASFMLLNFFFSVPSSSAIVVLRSQKEEIILRARGVRARLPLDVKSVQFRPSLDTGHGHRTHK